MPSEYESLVAALKLTSIPFAEYGWKTRPEGTYGVISLDMEKNQLNGDNVKLDRTWEGSVDVFFYKLSERDEIIDIVEELLEDICGTAWEVNSSRYETNTGLFHIEWIFEVTDEYEEPEPDPEPTPTPTPDPEPDPDPDDDDPEDTKPEGDD